MSVALLCLLPEDCAALGYSVVLELTLVALLPEASVASVALLPEASIASVTLLPQDSIALVAPLPGLYCFSCSAA